MKESIRQKASRISDTDAVKEWIRVEQESFSPLEACSAYVEAAKVSAPSVDPNTVEMSFMSGVRVFYNMVARAKSSEEALSIAKRVKHDLDAFDSLVRGQVAADDLPKGEA